MNNEQKNDKDWKESLKKRMNIEPGIHTGDKGPQKKYTFSFWYLDFCTIPPPNKAIINCPG
jgi:cell division protease FtsH